MPIPNQNKAIPIKRRKTEDTLVSWDSVTTANGNGGGSSLIDSGLIGSNDFITNQVTVIILGGAANLERQLCTAFNPATGEIDFSALSARIMAGTPYRLTGLMSPEVSVAGLAADLAVPLADSADDLLMRDVVGNKTDTPVQTSGDTASLMAYIKGILDGAGGTGKIYYGITVPAAGSMTINNDVLCIGDINVGDGGTLIINGDCHCIGSINNTTGDLTINGNCQCTNEIANNTGNVIINGNLFTVLCTQDDPTNNGAFYVYGNLVVTNELHAGATDGFVVTGNFTCVTLTFLVNGELLVVGDAVISIMNPNQDGVIFTVQKDCTITNGGFNLGNGVSGQIAVNGKLTAQAGFTTMAGSNITTGELESGSDVTIGGSSNFNGDVKINGALTDGNGAIIGDTSITGILTIGGSMLFNGNLKVGQDIVITGGDYFDVYGSCEAYTLTNAVTNNFVYIDGDLYLVYTLSLAGGAGFTALNVRGKFYCGGVVNLAAQSEFTTGSVEITGNCTIDDGGTTIINGDCKIAGDFSLGTGSGATMRIFGNLVVTGDIVLADATMSIFGNLVVVGNMNLSLGTILTAGPLTCNGDITNAGTITSNGGILYVGTYTNTGTVNNKMYKSP